MHQPPTWPPGNHCSALHFPAHQNNPASLQNHHTPNLANSQLLDSFTDDKTAVLMTSFSSSWSYPFHLEEVMVFILSTTRTAGCPTGAQGSTAVSPEAEMGWARFTWVTHEIRWLASKVTISQQFTGAEKGTVRRGPLPIVESFRS